MSTKITIKVYDTEDEVSETTLKTSLEDSDLQLVLAEVYEVLENLSTGSNPAYSKWQADKTDEGVLIEAFGAVPDHRISHMGAIRMHTHRCLYPHVEGLAT